MNALIGILMMVGFIGLVIVLDKRTKRIDAERLNTNKPDECDD